MGVHDLGTLVDAQRQPRATPRHEIVPHQLAKDEQRQTKRQQGDAFRKAVWNRDHGRCRATGATLLKSGTTDWQKLGEVDHSIPRSLAPERVYDVENGLLLMKLLNRLRKVACPRAPEYRMFDYTGPDDRGELQTFVWRDKDGAITNTRVG